MIRMKDIENLRKAEIIAPILLTTLAYFDPTVDPKVLEFAKNTASYVYLIDILLSGRTATITKDYKELNALYSEVLSRTADLAEDCEFNDPIEVFAFYVYLYRNGYLSVDREFIYDAKLIDFPNLQGIDVIRGKGVCRSISSMLSDLYYELGYDVTNLMVYATEGSVRKQIKLCDTPLRKSEESKKFVDLVISITSRLELANHQITMVKDENKSYILDPTNDGILNYNPNTKIIYAGRKKNYMKYKEFSQVSNGMLMGGVTNPEPEIRGDVELTDYKEKYLRTLRFCKDNAYLLASFYNENKQLYEDICKILAEQKDIIRRFCPIIPQFTKMEPAKVKKVTI